MRLKRLRLFILDMQIRYLNWRVIRHDNWLKKNDPCYDVNKAKMKANLIKTLEDAQNES